MTLKAEYTLDRGSVNSRKGRRGVGRGEGEMTYAHRPHDGQLGGAVCHQASDGGCRWSCGGRRVKAIYINNRDSLKEMVVEVGLLTRPTALVSLTC